LKCHNHHSYALLKQLICTIASLARLESRVSLEERHRRIPEYDIDESRLERVRMSNVHGFASVPIRF
jgi:hypothetical protein